MLLDAFEIAAQDAGCKKVAMIHMEDSFPNALKRLYRMKGYRFIESHYEKYLVCIDGETYP